MSRSEVTKYLKSNFEEVHGITSKRQVVSLITFFDIITFMILIINVACLGSIRACSVIFNPYGLKGIDTD
jgi:hypothetical protein